MAIYKCKMCGGDLNIEADVNVVECEYCGTTQTVPTVDNDKKVNLFNRANRLRINGEFDKAAGIYESIIAEFPEEAEAYWGLCLCNYGIEYVDDPATAKKVPTCHRASFEKLANDENFKLAMEYADVIAQKVYRDEAREIERILDNILSVSKNEKTYDVFICYKETDEKGERTIDSVFAQDIYDALTSKGLKVFFARITLEDKLGQMYEPYIFAALNSAKVLLSVGTKYEHFHAVWVKNEWSRFLKLMAKDKSKVLIPCYKDMDAYDLPDEFKALQAQDMGKIGFMQDLVRGVMKLCSSDEQVPNQYAASAINPQADVNKKQLVLKNNSLYSGEVFADMPHGYGKAEYENGDIYEGEWNRGNRNGQGKMIWNADGEWVGEFRDDKFWNGSGVLRGSNGSIKSKGKFPDEMFGIDFGFIQNLLGTYCYEGQIVDGKYTGYGKYVWSNGDVYEGEFMEGKSHGQGKKIWKDGGEWIGEFRDDKEWNGKGVIRYVDGNVYDGDLVDGKYTGYGKYFCKNGDIYEGEFSEGKFHGQGKIIYKDGGEWIGEYRDNNRWNGKGVIRYNDGDVYEGDLMEGKHHGQGKYIFKDGHIYEGEFSEGKFHGQGKIIWKDGGEWIGEYRDNNRWNGKGVIRYVDGYIYEGELMEGKHHGQGKLIMNDGTVQEGEFRNGKYQNKASKFMSKLGIKF